MDVKTEQRFSYYEWWFQNTKYYFVLLSRCVHRHFPYDIFPDDIIKHILLLYLSHKQHEFYCKRLVDRIDCLKKECIITWWSMYYIDQSTSNMYCHCSLCHTIFVNNFKKCDLCDKDTCDKCKINPFFYQFKNHHMHLCNNCEFQRKIDPLVKYIFCFRCINCGKYQHCHLMHKCEYLLCKNFLCNNCSKECKKCLSTLILRIM